MCRRCVLRETYRPGMGRYNRQDARDVIEEAFVEVPEEVTYPDDGDWTWEDWEFVEKYLEGTICS